MARVNRTGPWRGLPLGSDFDGRGGPEQEPALAQVDRLLPQPGGLPHEIGLPGPGLGPVRARIVAVQVAEQDRDQQHSGSPSASPGSIAAARA